jgi:hypothetical protein
MFAFICLRLAIPNKGQSQHAQMPNIIITENGINKLIQNINIHKASGPDNIHELSEF